MPDSSGQNPATSGELNPGNQVCGVNVPQCYACYTNITTQVHVGVHLTFCEGSFGQFLVNSPFVSPVTEENYCTTIELSIHVPPLLYASGQSAGAHSHAAI